MNDCTNCPDLVKLNERMNSLELRVSKQEQNDVTLNRLVTNVEVLVVKMTAINQTVEKVDGKVDKVTQELDKVKQEPMDDNKYYRRELVKWFLLLAAGYVLRAIQNGGL